MARALIGVPARAKRGETIEIKTLIQHPMETGYRRDATGGVVPRDIIGRFVCRFDGVEVFGAELHPAVAANPFISFQFVARASGEFAFSWTDERGATQTETARLVVE